jgi:hypothetical protein
MMELFLIPALVGVLMMVVIIATQQMRIKSLQRQRDEVLAEWRKTITALEDANLTSARWQRLYEQKTGP